VSSARTLSYKGEKLQVPARFGDRYRADYVLAAGGFGVALVARDERIFDRRVLVKISRYDSSLFRHPRDAALARRVNEQRDRLRFERGMLLAAAERGVAGVPTIVDWLTFDSPQLRGPHTAADGSTFETSDRLWRDEPCLVMSFVDGDPLHEACLDEHFRRSQFGNTKQLILQVGSVLEAMHAQAEHRGHRLSFVYQDLKPENAIFTRERQFVLIDFGSFAVCGVGPAGEPVVYDQNLLVSTPPYQAPEMTSGLPNEEKVTPAADVFSLAATVLHLLRGSAPIDPNTGEADLSLSGLDLPDRWSTWLTRALQPDPAKRFRNMAEALDKARRLPTGQTLSRRSA